MFNIPNLKFKTTLCNNWLEGTPCQKDLNCYFAHGQSQLRKIQENQQIISSRNQIYLQYQQLSNFKTVYCKFYAKGQCKLGASCTFAHQKKEKRKMNRGAVNQEPAIIPYMHSNIPFLYPPMQPFGMQAYYGQMIQPWEFEIRNVEKGKQMTQQQQRCQIQSKSQQKKRSRIQQSSTTEKQKEEIQNEQQIKERSPRHECFNMQ